MTAALLARFCQAMHPLLPVLVSETPTWEEAGEETAMYLCAGSISIIAGIEGLGTIVPVGDLAQTWSPIARISTLLPQSEHFIMGKSPIPPPAILTDAPLSRVVNPPSLENHPIRENETKFNHGSCIRRENDSSGGAVRKFPVSPDKQSQIWKTEVVMIEVDGC